MSRDEVLRLIGEDTKRRFTLSEDGKQLRAAQGHSVEVALELPPSSPPPTLFHGTARHALDRIFQDGLRPGRRQYVHLSDSISAAIEVGTRHGKPVALTVNCESMSSAGHIFWMADNGVWLTREVPPCYLSFA